MLPRRASTAELKLVRSSASQLRTPSTIWLSRARVNQKDPATAPYRARRGRGFVRRRASCRVGCGLPSARLQSALLLLPAPLAGELSPLPVVSPAPLRQ
jgi:hypothetical protein